MKKQKIQPRGKFNGYCVRDSNVLQMEYRGTETDSLEQRKAALKARLRQK